ncbi:hypothetical protein LJR078_001884 [Arthrobacter sp. LjRoot78]|uniref:hypothetical protein n=1 Tax=Arthrobacter sp. LjRoot78 TaxID=3342338 RepID=UPI003ECC2BDA
MGQITTEHFDSTYIHWYPANGRSQEITGFGFRFLTAAGHVDGLGSSISFDFDKYGPLETTTFLSVSGWIADNDLGDAGNHLYVIGAEESWQAFAVNIMTAFGEYYDPYPVTWTEFR